MTAKNSAIKSLIFLLPLLLASCNDTRNLPAKVENASESKATVVLVTPTPFTGQRAIVRGENLPIKFAGNFQDSIKQQEPPHVWLEFPQQNEENLKVELGEKINEKLKAIWQVSLTYRNVKRNSKSPDELYDASFNHSMTYIHSRDEMMILEVDSPDGKRRLTEGEIEEIIDVAINLMVDRYEELNDHFNQKN